MSPYKNPGRVTGDPAMNGGWLVRGESWDLAR